jgi:hypothetical protein
MSVVIGPALARLPRALWLVLGGAALLAALLFWHGQRVERARAAGAAAQAAVDRAAFEKAAAAAAQKQQRLVQALADRQAVISKGTEDELARDLADLARRYDDLRLRWAAARRGGDAGGGGAIAVSAAAGAVDDAACAARGWVDFNTAAAAAEAADTAIAKDDAWRAWAEAQGQAWPDQPAR